MIRSPMQRSLLATLLLGMLLPGALEAQRRGRSQEGVASGPWPPITIGIHFGYNDDLSSGTVLGAQIRMPIIRSAKIEVMPSGSVTFLTGLKEYQFNLDAVYVLGGRSGGLYAGGGLAVRNTLFTEGVGRETKTGGGVAVGFRSRPETKVGIQLEVRQIFLDSNLSPKVLTFGVNFPLWGGGSRPGR